MTTRYCDERRGPPSWPRGLRICGQWPHTNVIQDRIRNVDDEWYRFVPIENVSVQISNKLAEGPHE